MEKVAVRGQEVFTARVDGLHPYTKYSLRLRAWNDVGSVEAVTVKITEPAGGYFEIDTNYCCTVGSPQVRQFTVV